MGAFHLRMQLVLEDRRTLVTETCRPLLARVLTCSTRSAHCRTADVPDLLGELEGLIHLESAPEVPINVPRLIDPRHLWPYSWTLLATVIILACYHLIPKIGTELRPAGFPSVCCIAEGPIPP